MQIFAFLNELRVIDGLASLFRIGVDLPGPARDGNPTPGHGVGRIRLASCGGHTNDQQGRNGPAGISKKRMAIPLCSSMLDYTHGAVAHLFERTRHYFLTTSVVLLC